MSSIDVTDPEIREIFQYLIKVNNELQILVSTINVLLDDMNKLNNVLQRKLVEIDRARKKKE